MSKYEEHIEKILKNNSIFYIKEKAFSDLRGGLFRFDFYLPNFNCAIECDGQQHFYQVKTFQKTRKDFLKQQEHDRLKNSYCLAKRITLYRIPYWEINSISNINDIFKSKFLVKNRWHNDHLVVPKN